MDKDKFIADWERKVEGNELASHQRRGMYIFYIWI